MSGYRDISIAIDQLPGGLSEIEPGWYLASDLADVLEVHHRKVVTSAHAYCERKSAALPLLRKRQPEDPHGRKWRYQIDDEAVGSSAQVRELLESTALDRHTFADLLGVSKSLIDTIAREDRWIAKRLQGDFLEIVERYRDTASEWWAVCDVVLDRLIVTSVHSSAEAARDSRSSRRIAEGCDVTIVRGSGAEPELGLRLKASQYQERLT